MKPDENAQLKVEFQPKEIGKSEALIRIVVVDNPYENITISIEGESYNEAVVLEGLEFAENNVLHQSKIHGADTTRKNRKTSSRNLSAQSSRSI